MDQRVTDIVQVLSAFELPIIYMGAFDDDHIYVKKDDLERITIGSKVITSYVDSDETMFAVYRSGRYIKGSAVWEPILKVITIATRPDTRTVISLVSDTADENTSRFGCISTVMSRTEVVLPATIALFTQLLNRTYERRYDTSDDKYLVERNMCTMEDGKICYY